MNTKAAWELRNKIFHKPIFIILHYKSINEKNSNDQLRDSRLLVDSKTEAKEKNHNMNKWNTSGSKN